MDLETGVTEEEVAQTEILDLDSAENSQAEEVVEEMEVDPI